MATQAAVATGKRSYDDFEPFCKWQKEEENDTLEVHLHGFNKDGLRVQINNLGVLKISGSRALDETKWSRFHKEIKVSKDCKPNEIHAKFSGGILYVVMPKGSSEAQTITKTDEKPKQAPISAKNVTRESLGRESNVASASTSIGGDIENTNRLSASDGNNTMINSSKGRVSRLIRCKPMMVGVAVVVAVVVVVLVGIYVMNKYQTSDLVQA